MDKQYIWIIEYKGFDVLGKNQTIVISVRDRQNALKIIPTLFQKLKSKFPLVQWKEDVQGLTDPDKDSFSIVALNNPDIYIKIYKSFFWEEWSESKCMDVTDFPFVF